MQVFLPLLGVALTLGAVGDLPENVEKPDAPIPVEIREGNCRDTIQVVRSERGLPDLRKEAGAAPEPLLFKAVDHNIDGCDVLVMAGDTQDIRPLPKLEDRPPRLQPAR